MVAETPDVEAARTVYEAALTGHLVLTTLNAGSAGSAARWLVDMGIEPLLVSRSLVGIVAQRLARRICPECRIPAEISLSDPIPARLSRLAAIGGYDLPEETVFQRGAGCEKCRGRGYRGRVGIFEAMPFSRSCATPCCGARPPRRWKASLSSRECGHSSPTASARPPKASPRWRRRCA